MKKINLFLFYHDVFYFYNHSILLMLNITVDFEIENFVRFFSFIGSLYFFKFYIIYTLKKLCNLFYTYYSLMSY